MRLARRQLIFFYGLFTIAAQSLIFREFLTAFEGNDISVGIFFGTWFLWVGLAAFLIWHAARLAEVLLRNFELFLLCYLPAFVLELFLIIGARGIAGVESYVFLPIPTILLLAIVVTAPVSILTGLLFPIGCRWIRKDESFAVSRVYILEAAGSFVGGLGVTLLLAYGVSIAEVFLILAFLLSASVFAALAAGSPVAGSRARRVPVGISTTFVLLLSVCAAFCLFVGFDKVLMRHLQMAKWTKLLPKEAMKGAFQTAQAEYLYGIYQGQWVAVREGSVVEAVPDEEGAGRIAATVLCQNPKAERFLVIGSGLGLCREFLRLEQTETVVWAHCDNQYLIEVNKHIPAELRIIDGRLDYVLDDVRIALVGHQDSYDAVIVNLPDATSSVLNRYYTHQFYELVRQSLRPGGILAVRIAGGENIMGTELASLGASTRVTIEKVFSHFVIAPGEDSWFIASDSDQLSSSPAILQKRFAGIPGAEDVFPPAGLGSIYLPDRAAVALESYRRVDLPTEMLLNRDSKPLTHLYSLLLAAKQSAAPVTRFIKHLAVAGPVVFFVPLVVYVILRMGFVFKASGQRQLRQLQQNAVVPTGFDSVFLVFSAGWVAIGVSVTLMFLYQTRFGSLYLHIGIISSVFMLGLLAGALLVRQWLRGSAATSAKAPAALAPGIVIVHALILAALAVAGLEFWSHLTFAVAFFLSGFCSGCYFPLAAGQLADAGFEVGRTGAKLENADHLGAAAGGLVTGLLLVPVLGSRWAMFVFIALILTNVPAALLRLTGRTAAVRSPAPAAGFGFRKAGYVLLGIGASFIICSNLLAAAGEKLSRPLTEYAARALAGQSNIVEKTTVLKDKSIKYFEVYQPDGQLKGYVFSSRDFAPDVRGFGGRFNLAVYLGRDGKLIDFHLVKSNETPSYLRLLDSWLGSLKGRELFRPRPFAEVHAVTGATVSSRAIVSALESSAARFAADVLGAGGKEQASQRIRSVWQLPDAAGMYLLFAAIVTLIVIYRGSFSARLVVLVLTLIIGGLVLNAQYSTEQMITMLCLQSPAIGLSGVFLLVVAVPLLAIVFGNIYCGYICPFGAAQELAGFIVPNKLKPIVSAENMRTAGFIKYAVLFVLVVVFFVSRDRTTLAADPLTSVFSLRFDKTVVGSAAFFAAAAALVGSLFFTRFWCRYLCPAGAFLSLFNNVGLLSKYLPARKFGICEFRLTAKDRAECIYCDRCRYQAKDTTPPTARASSSAGRYFLVVVVVLGIFVSAVSVDRFRTVMASDFGRPSLTALTGGQPRDVDMERIRKMIREGKLSDREAEYYKKVE